MNFKRLMRQIKRRNIQELLAAKRNTELAVFGAMKRRMQGCVRANVGRVISRKDMHKLYEAAMEKPDEDDI